MRVSPIIHHSTTSIAYLLQIMMLLYSSTILGIILFVMLAGEFPWKPQTEGYSLMNEITLGRYTLPSRVSKDAGNLIGSILLLNPDDRPSTAQILAHPWLLA